MTLRRLYAGFIQPYLGMGLARADVAEAERTALFQKYVQWMCQQDLPGRRVVCEAEVLSVTPAPWRGESIPVPRGMVPKDNAPARAEEYLWQLNDEAAYSFQAVCKCPDWPGTFTAFLHRDLGRELAGAGGAGKAVQLSGFLSPWLAVPPAAGRDMQLVITLEACVRTGGRAAPAEDEAQRYLNVADTYMKAHMPEKAVKSLQTVLDRYPRTEAAQQAAKMIKDIEKASPTSGAAGPARATPFPGSQWHRKVLPGCPHRHSTNPEAPYGATTNFRTPARGFPLRPSGRRGRRCRWSRSRRRPGGCRSARARPGRWSRRRPRSRVGSR